MTEIARTSDLIWLWHSNEYFLLSLVNCIQLSHTHTHTLAVACTHAHAEVYFQSTPTLGFFHGGEHHTALWPTGREHKADGKAGYMMVNYNEDEMST